MVRKGIGLFGFFAALLNFMHGCSSASSAQGADAGSVAQGFVECLGACEGNDKELLAYNQCVRQKLDAKYRSCFGEGYAEGKLGGPCAEEERCNQKCACGDNACRKKCPVTEGCVECTNPLYRAASESGCTRPLCRIQSVSCRDLAKCCTTAACQNAIELEEGPKCFGLLSAEKGEGRCGGIQAPACIELLKCCKETTDDSIRSTCETTATSDLGDSCVDAHRLLRENGYCK